MAFSLEVLSLYVPGINRVNDLKHGDSLMMRHLQLVTLELRLLESIPKAFRIVLIVWWLVS